MFWPFDDSEFRDHSHDYWTRPYRVPYPGGGSPVIYPPGYYHSTTTTSTGGSQGVMWSKASPFSKSGMFKNLFITIPYGLSEFKKKDLSFNSTQVLVDIEYLDAFGTKRTYNATISLDQEVASSKVNLTKSSVGAGGLVIQFIYEPSNNASHKIP